MGTAEKATLNRIGRSAVAVVIAEILKYVTASPAAIIAVPIISGLGKLLRVTLGWTWLPF